MGDRTWLDSIQKPAQAVVPCGVAGEYLNPFQAPSRWNRFIANLVAAAPETAVLAPTNLNWALRIYRYTITIEPAAFPCAVDVILGVTIQAYYVAANTAPTYFMAEFGPTGISHFTSTQLTTRAWLNNAIVSIFVQWSNEPTGDVADGTGLS